VEQKLAVPPDALATHRLIHDRVVDWLRREAHQDISEVDYDASLFELGIDSLGAASIAAELEEATGKCLDPEAVFELETIRELAEYLDLVRAAVPKVVEAPAVDEHPPLEQPIQGADDAAPSDPVEHYRRLNRRVRQIQDAGLYFFEPEIAAHDGAWVTVGTQRMLMFGSYEYLGLLSHPQPRASAIRTIEEFGTGHHGARLLAGTTTVHRRLEARLAKQMRAEEAIVYSSGYVTNLSTISTLVGRGDCVIGDQWNHASIVDGCRMSGAQFLEFRHNDIDSLAERLAQAGGRRTLVVVDSVFSMDGDLCDLPAVVRECRRHGALLMVDEAHSLGVLGRTGGGVQEHFDLPPDAIDVKMGTLSKTLASVGGFVAGKREIVTYLRHHARGYIFSGALPSPQAAAALASLEVLEREPERVAKLWDNVDYYVAGLKDLEFDTGVSVTPIVPIMTGDDETTLEMTRICRAEGLLAIPVCYPAVPANAPRLRTCVSAVHERSDLDFALDVLGRAGRQTGLIGPRTTGPQR
jgi:glycine C-acetyltransferase